MPLRPSFLASRTAQQPRNRPQSARPISRTSPVREEGGEREKPRKPPALEMPPHRLKPVKTRNRPEEQEATCPRRFVVVKTVPVQAMLLPLGRVPQLAVKPSPVKHHPPTAARGIRLPRLEPGDRTACPRVMNPPLLFLGDLQSSSRLR
jgi:hypothetical protein